VPPTAQIGARGLGLGEHPDWRFWPERSRFPVIDGERWFLCTDGCYFVSVDRPGMLIPPAARCDACGCPIHPAAFAGTGGRSACAAHRGAEPSDDWDDSLDPPGDED